MNVHSAPDLVAEPYADYLGIRFLRCSKDCVVGELDADTMHLSGNGAVHGGVLMGFADALGARGALLNLAPAESTATIESKINFLRAAKPGRLTGVCNALHRGRTTSVWQIDISGSDGIRTTQATQTQIILPAASANQSALAPESEVTAHGAASPANANANGSTLPEVRREHILSVAMEAFAKKGFDKATMREIAAAAKLPVGALYLYFKNKDEILATIFDQYLRQIETQAVAAATRGATPREKLRNIITVNLENFDRFQKHIRVMNRETKALAPDVRKRVIERMHRFIALFNDAVATGVASGEFRKSVDPVLIGNLIEMMCELWPLRQWSVGNRGLPAVQSSLIDLVLNGVLESPRTKRSKEV